MEAVVRACIGLAYPIGAAEGERTRLETIPADGRAPSTVSHNDLNIGNIMFGDQDGRFVEHSLVPVAKFIDLGSITEKEGGVADNVLKIGTVCDLPTYPVQISIPASFQFSFHLFHLFPSL